MSPAQKQLRFQILLAFGLVYVFWGSTYLFIAVAVRDIPPVLMAGMRFLIAGPLMLAWCALNCRRVLPSAQDLRRLTVIALLLLTGGNVLLAWSEQYVPSGFAALVVAVVPIYVAVIEMFTGGDRLSSRGWLGLLFGFGGMIALLWPKLAGGISLENRLAVACGVLVVGSLSWTVGSIASRRFSLSVDAFSATGWEMTIAGGFNTALALGLGDHHRANFTWGSVGSVMYLVVFGSWVGFTAYIWLLEHVPTPKVATYAYVNPIVAVALGSAFNSEPFDGWMLAGTIIIVTAVALVTSSKISSAQKTPCPPELAPCEQEAD